MCIYASPFSRYLCRTTSRMLMTIIWRYIVLFIFLSVKKKSLSRLGERHMINLYFGSIFVYIPLSVPWVRTTRIIIFRRCRDKRFMFLSFLCNKDSDEFFLIPNVFSVFYIESSKCIILYKWKRLCISR